MTQIIFHIILIAVTAVWFSEHSGIVFQIKKRVYYKHKDFFARRLKPIDCPLCLAWWGGLIYFGSTYGLNALVYAACASALAIWVSKKMAL
jgi:hypothetical protein